MCHRGHPISPIETLIPLLSLVGSDLSLSDGWIRGGCLHPRGGVSLATSWLLVTRLERVGERLGLSEASLGMVAALAADTPRSRPRSRRWSTINRQWAPESSSARTSSISRHCWAWAPLWPDESSCTEKSSSSAAPSR